MELISAAGSERSHKYPLLFFPRRVKSRQRSKHWIRGADDFVTKPFGIDELLARVRASLRRSATSVADEAALTVIDAGDFHVDLESRKLTVLGREIHLTPKEFDLLTYFIQHPGKVLTHRTLLAAVWGGTYIEQNEYLRVFVGNLRKKIESDPATPRYIITEPWTGYRFDPGQ